ncbi:carboxypeptidase-like regulatory domain-containing protein [Hyunsoonleella rubra]|uniref:Carboxypeptidase-like regulatory domain-containing protein n=1 Tax=Hyunsoonleella rubra TaxID=1737062 RepID=A0ABW5TB52_9FLAO
MAKSQIIISFFLLFVFKLTAQINLRGTVYFDNKPKSDVTVYLNNTTIGAITDNNGEFNLEVNNGVYELIISHIGFKTMKYNFDTSNYTKPLVFSLLEEEVVLDEVVIKEKKNNDEWEHNFSVFFREFMGTTKFSKSCTIQNPDVLFFEFDSENNILRAEAIEPLQIRNEALGYDIFCDLKYFSVEKNNFKYLGYSYFLELKGSKNKQKKWRKNRLKAYNGSPIHFYKSILKNSSKEEGFVIDAFVRKKNKDKPSEEELLKARKELSKSNVILNFSRKHIDYLYKSDIASSEIIHKENNKTYLKFDNNLRITYLKEKQEKGYVLRYKSNPPIVALPQVSNIIPLTEKIIISPQGILANPLNNVLYEEYWAYERSAHALPLDYEPNYGN